MAPLKRKRPIGIGATAKAKKAKAASAATPAFNAAVAKAVKRVEAQSQETTYSTATCYLNSSGSTYTLLGYSLTGLNSSAAWSASSPGTRANATNQVFYCPLSVFAQVGNTSTPGYRKGQRINPVGFRISIEHNQSLATINSVYKWAVCRNKGNTILNAGNTITSPGITQQTSLSLFAPFVQGPLVSASSNTSSLPLGDFPSAMRWNHQEWSLTKRGSYTMPAQLARENSSVGGSATATSGVTIGQTKTLTAYVPIKDTFWDYPSPTAINGIKGGDYFFVLWREGACDSLIALDQITMLFELSFKDP